jgi:phage-related protein
MPVGHDTTYIDPISMTVNNEGNTESAPSITIEGEGAVEVTVDGLIAFEINMPTTGTITIDSKAMDATDGDGNLANRSVSGDYTNLQLAPGEHTVVVVGDVSNVTIKNVSRWL